MLTVRDGMDQTDLSYGRLCMYLYIHSSIVPTTRDHIRSSASRENDERVLSFSTGGPCTLSCSCLLFVFSQAKEHAAAVAEQATAEVSMNSTLLAEDVHYSDAVALLNRGYVSEDMFAFPPSALLLLSSCSLLVVLLLLLLRLLALATACACISCPLSHLLNIRVLELPAV